MTKVTYDIDYTRRCVRPYELAPGVECQMICYGITADELGDGGHDGADLSDKFDHSAGRGRRPGGGAERTQHFFNKRIV